MADNPNLFSTFSALDIVPVTPSDTVDLTMPARALRCAAGGNLRITTIAGNVRNTVIAVGEILTVQVTRVHATGTTATGVEALI